MIFSFFFFEIIKLLVVQNGQHKNLLRMVKPIIILSGKKAKYI